MDKTFCIIENEFVFIKQQFCENMRLDFGQSKVELVPLVL